MALDLFTLKCALSSILVNHGRPSRAYQRRATERRARRQATPTHSGPRGRKDGVIHPFTRKMPKHRGCASA